MSTEQTVEVRLPGLDPFLMSVGDKLEISKQNLPVLPVGFRTSILSLPLPGQRHVYRDERRRLSLQLRDFGTHWRLELDGHNPESGLIPLLKHAVFDAPHVTAGVLVIGLLARRAFRG